MSGTISSGRAAGERAGAVTVPGSGHGRGRWVAALLVAVLVAAGVVGAALAGVFKDDMLRPACGWLSWQSGPG